MTRQPCIYILASKKDGILYIGITSHLLQRVWQHKSNLVEGFTKKLKFRGSKKAKLTQQPIELKRKKAS
jgi:predicted GIY-YIG superfamily endonuclease